MNGDRSRQPPQGIEADRLEFSYSSRRVLSSVSFTVGPGTVYGLLGRNGAGKTTTLSILAGLLRPAGGRASLAGHSVLEDPVGAKRELGFVPDEPVLFGSLTGIEHLGLVLDLRADRDDRDDREARVARVLELCGLAAPDARRFTGQYSRGMRQRLVIAMALIGRPSCLVLDEPVGGLDPAGLADLKQILRDAADDGSAVLISSHNLDVVRGICDRIGILHGGVITAEHSLPSGDLDLEREFLTATAKDGDDEGAEPNGRGGLTW